MKSLGAGIAHELRTPLCTIISGVNSIKKSLPQLLTAYQIAKDNHLNIPEIDFYCYESLPVVFSNIESEAQAAFTIIDMLLVKVKQLNVEMVQMERCSIAHCIDEAIRRYPFDFNERSLIEWHQKNNFSFMGNELLIEHIIFNLLKNAFYYIKAAGKGNIKIWLERGEKYNLLYFRDTGSGISKKALPHIFDRFYSQTYHGAGIGLAFCKAVMHSFGGSITCVSEEKEYAEFCLKFPVDDSLVTKELDADANFS